MGRDPELRTMPSGVPACSFSLATSDKWRDKNTGEMREATEWHRVVAFDKTAEIVNAYTKKGTLVYVDGSLRTRKYTDNSNAERTVTEIRADRVLVMSGGRSDGEAHQQQRTSAPSAAPAPQSRPAPATTGSGFDDMSDDIPF